MTDWEMKVHNFMCLNKFVKKGEIVFTGSSLCELFPINEMLQNAEPRIRVYNRGIDAEVEKMAAELNCTYINVFDCLLDEKGNLKAEYTIEGMHMYANGYAVVLEKLMPYLLEE